MIKVQVLMSTYNGEKYLIEQIDSILNQKGNFKLSLLVRDDDSTDNTRRILEEYAKNKKLKWYSGKNLGSAKSFIDLILKSESADYYAFADQDDFWEENKIENAIEKLEENNSKLGKIYFSSLKLVDENLNFKMNTVFNEQIDFKKGMIRNQATGCTIVFNKYVREYIKNTKFDYVCMHDSLIYRLALLYNWFIYRDDNSYIKYRQHNNNVLGMSYSKFDDFKKKFKRFFTDECEASLTSKELLKLSNIDEDKRKYLDLLSSYKKSITKKIKLLFMNKYKCGIIIGDITIKIKIIFNRL